MHSGHSKRECKGNKCLQNGDVVVDLCTMFLRDTFCNPNDVAAFLFLQFQIGVKDSKVKLLHKRVDIQFDL